MGRILRAYVWNWVDVAAHTLHRLHLIPLRALDSACDRYDRAIAKES